MTMNDDRLAKLNDAAQKAAETLRDYLEQVTEALRKTPDRISDRALEAKVMAGSGWKRATDAGI